MGDRLSKSNLPHRVKHPVILPNDGFISDLIIRDAHVATGHSGRQQTLAYIRESFWLIKASSSVHQAIANCVTCRKLFGQPCKSIKNRNQDQIHSYLLQKNIK